MVAKKSKEKQVKKEMSQTTMFMNGIVTALVIFVCLFILLFYVNPAVGLIQFEFANSVFLALEAAVLSLIMFVVVTSLIQRYS